MAIAYRLIRKALVFFCLSSYVQANYHSWQTIQNKAQYAIVQIINHHLEIDDLVPFRRDGSEGRGSGFIIENGYILTNFHVVRNCIRVFMQMPLFFGQHRFELDLVGIAPEFDLALLKIKDEDQRDIVAYYGSLPFLALGDSDNIKKSDELLGIGFPLGETSPKSATGIVSGYQTIMIPPSKIYAIQVTKPTNPGNSGGPLLDTQGDVVGIDVAIPGMPTNSIAYAIPINDFKIVEAQLKQGELVEKTYFGCSYCCAKGNELAEILGNPIPAGCYITRVFDDGLMQEWGIQQGDMLYRINGLVIDPFASIILKENDERKPFADYVLSFPLGSYFTLELYRSGQRIEQQVQLVFKRDLPIAWRYVDYHVDYEIIGGLLIQELSLNVMQAFSKAAPQIHAKLYNYQEDEKKRKDPVLVVTQVLAGSLAAEARVIGVGELINQVNGITVTTLAELRKALITSDNNFVTMTNRDEDLIVLNKAEVCAQEPHLARYFGYTTTPGMQSLLQYYTHKRK